MRRASRGRNASGSGGRFRVVVVVVAVGTVAASFFGMANQSKESVKDLYRTDSRGKVHRDYDKGFVADVDTSPRVKKTGAKSDRSPAKKTK